MKEGPWCTCRPAAPLAPPLCRSAVFCKAACVSRAPAPFSRSRLVSFDAQGVSPCPGAWGHSLAAGRRRAGRRDAAAGPPPILRLSPGSGRIRSGRIRSGRIGVCVSFDPSPASGLRRRPGGAWTGCASAQSVGEAGLRNSAAKALVRSRPPRSRASRPGDWGGGARNEKSDEGEGDVKENGGGQRL